jgi:hypothetical protein
MKWTQVFLVNMTLDKPTPPGKTSLEWKYIYVENRRWNTTSTWNKWTWYNSSLSQAATQVQEWKMCPSMVCPPQMLLYPMKWSTLAPWSSDGENLAHNFEYVSYLSIETVLKAIWPLQDLPAISAPSSSSVPSSKQEQQPQISWALSLHEPSMKGGAQALLSQCFHSHLLALLQAPLVNIQVRMSLPLPYAPLLRKHKET